MNSMLFAEAETGEQELLPDACEHRDVIGT